MKDFDGPMKLSQLRMFVAVADSGSFSAAAALLGCTQSRISHALAELEGELGTALLLRGRTGSAPTEAGKQALATARQMLRLEADLLASMRGASGMRGTVRIACFRSVGTHLLPQAVEALARAHPGLHVDIDDSCEERGDVGAALLPLEGGLEARPYLFDDYVMVVPAALPVDSRQGWPELGALPFIQLGCSGAAAILARCRDAGFTAQAARTLANDTSIAAMVGRGMGYSILPRLSIFPEPGDVKVLPLPIPARRQFAIAALPEVMRQAAVRAVVRTLRDRTVAARTQAGQAGIVNWE